MGIDVILLALIVTSLTVATYTNISSTLIGCALIVSALLVLKQELDNHQKAERFMVFAVPAIKKCLSDYKHDIENNLIDINSCYIKSQMTELIHQYLDLAIGDNSYSTLRVDKLKTTGDRFNGIKLSKYKESLDKIFTKPEINILNFSSDNNSKEETVFYVKVTLSYRCRFIRTSVSTTVLI